MAFAFVALCTTSMAGCDLSGIVSDIIAGALGGDGGCVGNCAAGCGSCGSCGDCSSCSSCGACSDCGGCAGCQVDCSPYLRDMNGKNQGFNGSLVGTNANVHTGRRIANAVQFRLTQSGYAFLQREVPSLITGLLGSGGIALPGSLAANGQSPGKIYLELRSFALAPADNVCNGNAQNNFGNGHDCIRATMNAYFRSCDNTGGCTMGETVPVTIGGIPLLGSLTCNLNLDASRGTYPNGLSISADVGTLSDTAPAAHAGYSRLAIIDAQVPNTATLEGADVQVTCPNVSINCTASLALLVGGAVAQGVSIGCDAGWPWDNCSCSINPNGLVTSAMADLRGQLNNIVDAQLQTNAPKLCQAAQNVNDCPTGSTYVAPAMGAVSPTNPGSCTITGSNPARCVEILLGLEARIGVGGALGSISPGIEAVIDFLGAMGGELNAANNGSNGNIFLGMESWVAGIRGLRHNPCVPIEHPAANQAACDALGSGWEYEGVLQDGTTNQGRCIPRIPILPVSTQLQGNAPQNPASADANYEVGVGVSEEFMSYAAWKLWDSGALCINAGTWLNPLISPSLISFALFPPETVPRLFFPLAVNTDDPNFSGANSNKSSVALMLHPQTAPVISLDEIVDPCEATDKIVQIDVQWDRLQIDLSIWSNDRYARAGTIETDVHVIVNLDLGAQAAGAAGCPAIADGTIAISVPTLAFGNAHWLSDSPNLTPFDFRIGEFTGSLPIQSGFDTIGGIAGGLIAGLVPPVAVETLINDALAGATATLGMAIPIRVNIDPDAFQVVAQNGVASGAPYDTGVRNAGSRPYNFLAVYTDLTNTAGFGALAGSVDTQVQVTHVSKPSDASAYDMHSGTFGAGELPSVEISMSATGPANAEFEYAYRTSLTGWSAWQRSSYAVISDRALLVQGGHEVLARARVAGEDSSTDMTSATASFVIDPTPPMIQVYERTGGGQQLQALDLVSDALEYRVQEPGSDFGSWQALPASGIKNVNVPAGSVFEVRDEEGNVGSSAQSLQGRANAATNTACASCATAGAQSQTPALAIVGGLLALGAVVSRRRRRFV